MGIVFNQLINTIFKLLFTGAIEIGVCTGSPPQRWSPWEMSWHIIYTKCDKGCVSDLLSRTVCRLKALVCLPQIMAMAGGGTTVGLGSHWWETWAQSCDLGAAWARDGGEGALAQGLLLDGKNESGFVFFFRQLSTLTAMWKARKICDWAVEVRLPSLHSCLVIPKPASPDCQTSPGQPGAPVPLPGARGGRLGWPEAGVDGDPAAGKG